MHTQTHTQRQYKSEAKDSLIIYEVALYNGQNVPIVGNNVQYTTPHNSHLYSVQDSHYWLTSE